MKSEEFIDEIANAARGLKLPKAALEQIREVTSGHDILAHYIIKAPMPSFPNNLLDVFALTRTGLYDIELRKGGLRWHFLASKSITAVESGEAQKAT